MKNKQIKLHGNPFSACTYHVKLMLDLCQVEHEFIIVNLPAGEHKTEKYRAMNPFEQIPVLQIGDEYIYQSWLILEYLAQETGKFYTTDPTLIREIKTWLYWNIDKLFMPLGYANAYELGFFESTESVREANRVKCAQNLEIFSKLLGTREYLVGDALTIADIAVYSSIANARDGKIPLGNWDNIVKWQSRIESLPNFYVKEKL